MDAFEQVVSEILWMEGYWVKTSFRVELTQEDKGSIGRHSSPRWELDVVAYRGSDNAIKVVECKSYLNSVGVRACAFDGTSPKHAERYKLFNEHNTRNVVLRRLQEQLFDSGRCAKDPRVDLALACGKIRNDADRQAIRSHFDANNWELWDEAWLREKLREMAKQGYENQVSAVVSKLLRDEINTKQKPPAFR